MAQNLQDLLKDMFLQPDADVSKEPAEIKAVCDAVWTDAVKTAWTEYQKTTNPGG